MAHTGRQSHDPYHEEATKQTHTPTHSPTPDHDIGPHPIQLTLELSTCWILCPQQSQSLLHLLPSFSSTLHVQQLHTAPFLSHTSPNQPQTQYLTTYDDHRPHPIQTLPSLQIRLPEMGLPNRQRPIWTWSVWSRRSVRCQVSTDREAGERGRKSSSVEVLPCCSGGEWGWWWKWEI